MPELLTRKSSFPPVSSFTALAAALIESEFSTLRGRVSIPRPSKCSSLEGFRPVARTRTPLRWNSRARASPIPPLLHPVMSTVFLGVVDMVVSGVQANLKGARTRGRVSGQQQSCLQEKLLRESGQGSYTYFLVFFSVVLSGVDVNRQLLTRRSTAQVLCTLEE